MKLRILFFFIVSIFSYKNISAQQGFSITGKITNTQTGNILPGATIFFPDLKKGTASDEKGIYSISNIPKGIQLIEVSYQGYGSVIDHIDINGNTEKDFSLSPTFIENENVTITGVASATSVKRSAVPVSILKKEDLFGNISTNLIDNIAKTPGVSQISTGPAISKPVIRGLGYNRVVVVNDGIRQEGQQWGDEHGIEIDEQNVNKVEILKGPASLMYGSDALAGVINIISIKPVNDGQTEGNISGGYQSNNKQRNFHGDINGNYNGFIWGVNGSYKAAADYKNKYDGYVFNSKFNERNFGGYIGLNKEWGYSHLYISHFDQKLGLTEGSRDYTTGKFLKLINNAGSGEEVIATNADFKTINPLVPRQRIQHFKIAADNSFIVGKDRISVIAGFQQNQRQEFGNVVVPDEKSLWFNLKTFNYNIQYHFAPHKNWNTTVGVNGMQQANINKGIETLIPEYSLFDIGGFAFTQKRINEITVSGGIRFDNRSLNSKELTEGSDIKFAAFKKDFSNASGSIGLSYQVNKATTLKLNLAKGFRAPSIPELASNGPHEGTLIYEYGQPNLKSETSYQADAGIDVASEHVSFTASLFYNSINNFIYKRKLLNASGNDSTVTVDGTDEFMAFVFDQNKAKLYGLEFNFDIHPHPLDWLHIENSFSYVRGVISEEQDGSKNLPFIPAARLINEVKAEFVKKSKYFKNCFIKVELDNTFKQNKPFTGYHTETATAGYSLLNAGIGGNIINKGKTLFTILLAANNISDVAYQSHLSRLKYAPENLVTGRVGVFNMGRNFSVKINIPLSISGK